MRYSAFLAALNGCSPAAFVNSLVPTEGYVVARDIAYGAGPRRKLDVYTPTAVTAAGQAAPVVVFFYGGAWYQGSREDYLFLGQALTERGFVVVVPDYRLNPEVIYPAFLEDGADAIAWVKREIGRYGGDSGRVYLMGHSAGAYNAVMLTLDERWLNSRGFDPRRDIRATAGLAGPYDFLPLNGWLKKIFGAGDDPAATQPINHVHGDDPPLLLLNGLSDTTVLPRNAQRLAAVVRTKGGAVEEKYYVNVGHIPLIGALAHPMRFVAPVLDDVTSFFRAH